MGKLEKQTFEQWLAECYPTYNYEEDKLKKGAKRADKHFAKIWAKYEKYLDSDYY